MAHGYYLATGRPQAVMVHTNVGLANAVMGLINAASDNVPMLVIGGRTPVLEHGRPGARTVPIGWGQEMLDQHALIREACKWDYELRFPEQVWDLMDRAHGIAMSSPRGPVYVSLPREVLCQDIPAAPGRRRPQMQPAMTAAPPDEIARAADLLAAAESPVIFAQMGAGSSDAFAALGRMAQGWGIPVCQYWAVRLAMETTHSMAAGPDPAPLLADADVILVIDSLAPWAPMGHEPMKNVQIIHISPDPLRARSGVRNFRVDLGLAGETGPTLMALAQAMEVRQRGRKRRNAARAKAVAARNTQDRAARANIARAGRDAPRLGKPWISAALARAVAGTQTAIFGELGCMLPYMELDHQDAWFDGPHSGGLGWGMPAAMGYKLANPDKTVIATLGDGSYIFANPVACHQIAAAMGLSIVVIVLNNAEWGAVRRSVLDLYPDGYAARANSVPLTSLSPSPDFTMVAQASGARARHVDDADEFETALADALDHVRADKGLALIEVAIGAG